MHSLSERDETLEQGDTGSVHGETDVFQSGIHGED